MKSKFTSTLTALLLLCLCSGCIRLWPSTKKISSAASTVVLPAATVTDLSPVPAKNPARAAAALTADAPEIPVGTKLSVPAETLPAEITVGKKQVVIATGTEFELVKPQVLEVIATPSQPLASATPVKAAISKLLILVWVAGIAGLLAGIALIVWLSQLWLGLKLIGCSVGAIIAAEWFAVHYVGTIIVLLIGGGLWIVFDHLITWSSVTKWIEKQASTVEKNVTAELGKVEKKI